MVETATKRELFTDGALEVFVAELQHYGGNAAANLVRGAGVSYAEILNDTLDHLRFVGKRDQQVELLELAVLRRQAEMLWDLGTPELQAKIANALETQASWNAVSDALTTDEGLMALASFLCGAEYPSDLLHAHSNLAEDGASAAVSRFGALGMLAGKAIGKTASGLAPNLMGKVVSTVSSHRITLPCVNQLIRIRLINERVSDAVAIVQAEKRESAGSNVTHLHSPGSFVIKDQAGQDTFSMSDLSIHELPTSAKRLDVEKVGISRLSPLLQAAPTAALANEVSGERFMKVVVNGPLTLAKDGNGFRGFVQGTDGKITEHVRLFDGDLSKVVNAAAVFNVASMALAQKHLADISARLDDIQQGVDQISTFQKRQRQAEIVSATQYLRQIADSVMAGEIRDVFEKQLESMELSLLGVQNHLHADIEGLIAEASSAKDDGKFGMTVFRDKLTGLQGDFDEVVHLWKLCVAARMMACRLLCNFPETRHSVEGREKRIRENVAWMLGPKGAIDRMRDSVGRQLSKFSAWGDSRIELQASRETVRIAQQARLPALEHQTEVMAEEFERLMHESRSPLELMLVIRNGRVAEMATS
ncbi:hypothetical protein LF41_2271 [Lysobacter dokdonensis DS-58]|uniref:Uncharacterized protein n=2 Tax=Noviluteimonas TaxID=3382693 RepID=A0A0A2X3G9_9GAMM|nr:hypothetical protein LF41_2271 [Lysobacter dokdonensis DS-58]